MARIFYLLETTYFSVHTPKVCGFLADIAQKGEIRKEIVYLP